MATKIKFKLKTIFTAGHYTNQRIESVSSSCTLELHVSLLKECKLVLRVGVVAARLVSFEHIKPWLVNSYQLNDKPAIEQYIPRPAKS